MWKSWRHVPLFFSIVLGMFEPGTNFLKCNLNIVNTRVLLWGDASLTYIDNGQFILVHIHVYIRKSKHFNINRNFNGIICALWIIMSCLITITESTTWPSNMHTCENSECSIFCTERRRNKFFNLCPMPLIIYISIK